MTRQTAPDIRTAPKQTTTGDDWRPRILLLAAGAVLLRLLLFLGRGHYTAFDEGFYLLLGRSLVSGDGFSLVGIPHVALSPLFPALAGIAGLLVDDWVWGGRLVAALASGLLVLPCWAIFRRLAPRKTAFIGCALIAVLPSMAPFVVPFWIGADLWVGAEPLLHLLLIAAIALWMRADERDRLLPWLATGAVFALAYLARPEAIITWGLLGLAALAIAARRRSPRRLLGAVLMAVGFALVAAPYWVYLHDTTGRWTLTGRGVSAGSVAAAAAPGARAGAAGSIERMLWEDDASYIQGLYSLDRSGERLASPYWGVYPSDPRPRQSAPADDARPTTQPRQPTSGSQPPATDPPSPLRLYGRSLGAILPLLLWPLVILGMAQPRGRAVLLRELPVSGSLLLTSLAIAALVAVDPRTQLFLVPLLAFYAARGLSLIERQVQASVRGEGVRAGLIESILAIVAIVWMLGIDARRLQLSLTLGSPHHVVAEQNRDVAREIDSLVGDPDGPLMSWHPSLAIFADRDWRVLPFTDLPGIVGYAGASGAEVIVLSAYYPPDLGVERVGVRYLVVDVPEQARPGRRWRLRLERGDSIRALGRLQAADDGG